MSTGTETTAASEGLRGVVAAQSAIGDVNGEQGILIYQGYNIHDLAEHSTFEEVIFLLWNGRLPKADELAELEDRLPSRLRCLKTAWSKRGLWHFPYHSPLWVLLDNPRPARAGFATDSKRIPNSSGFPKH